MTDKIFTREEIEECLAPVFKQYGVKSAVLFGSYSKGTATVKSDIDILVDSNLRGLKFSGLIESVRESLGDKRIDLFDVTHIERDSLIDKDIKKTGIRIYG